MFSKRNCLLIIGCLSLFGCGREASNLLRQGQLPISDFPLYMSEGSTGTIWKFERDGSRVSFATGLSFPFGIATDRYQHLYVVDRDSSAGRLLKFDTITGNSTVLLGGLKNPSVVAVDSVGEVFVAQDTPHNIIRVSDQKVIANFYSLPGAMAFGVSDLMIVGDSTTNFIYWGTSNIPGATVSSPVNISIDQMGRVYIAEGKSSGAKVWRYNQTDGSNGAVVADTLKGPTGIAVDPVGNVYIAEKGNSRLTLVTIQGEFYSFYSPMIDPGYLAFTQY